MRNLLLLGTCFMLALSVAAQSVSAQATAQTTAQTPAQPVQISGIVTSSENAGPLAGVTVTVSGTTRGTVTGGDGAYSIPASDGETLVFSYLGYQEQRVALAGQRNVNVALNYDATQIDELVVVGYGTMKKSDLTGAVGSVNGDVLQKSPVATVTEALQGRLAGVTVTSDSGQPGSGATVRIRGIGSVTSGTAPLFVVDGMIVDNIDFLSPNDIASTEVLKDASSAAIYGSRAANGVILVTTKTGKKGDRMNITFETYVGVQNRWNKLDLMDGKEYLKTYFDINSGVGGTVGATELNYFQNGGLNQWLRAYKVGSSAFHPVPGSSYDYAAQEIDWQDAVFVKNAVIQNYYIGMDGGTDKLSYSFSANYFNQAGTIIGSKYDRLNFRLNTSYQARKWLKVGQTLSFSTSRSRRAMNNSGDPGASILSGALAMAPWDPITYPAGTVNAAGKDIGGNFSASTLYSQGTNPYAMDAINDNRNNSHNWLGSIYVDMEFFKGFTFHSDVSFNFGYARTREFTDKFSAPYNNREKNSVGQSSTFNQNLVFTNYATYARSLGKHDFSLMVGHTVEMSKNESVSAGGSILLNSSDKFWYVDNATDPTGFTQGGSYHGEYRRMSVMGRLFYQFDNRYMITANFRADANRAFKQLWGYFPSVAVAWKINEESFLRGSRNVNLLKLRLGWGLLGNDNVPANLSTMEMFQSNNMFVGYPLGPNVGDAQAMPTGATVLTQANLTALWEKTQHINVGVDFGFWQNRLSGSVDYFVRDTRDMLMYRKWANYAGVLWPAMDNIGTMRNEGVEISLEHQNTVNTSAGPLFYSIGGNISFVKNTVLSTGGADRVYGDRSITDEGYSIYSFWGYEYDGIFRTQSEINDFFRIQNVHAGASAEEIAEIKAYNATRNKQQFQVGDPRYKDLNGDGELDAENDMKVTGNPFPKFTYGFNFGLEYFGFDLQLFFQGVYGNTIYNAVKERTEGTGLKALLSTTMRDVWTATNLDGSIPNPLSTRSFFNSSRFLEDGSYLRLKNLQFGYTIPLKATQKMRIQKLRLYFSAQNLFTITKYTGYDPEVGGGVDYGNYPQSRTLMLGVNINF